MDCFEQEIRAAIAGGNIPGAVLLATDATSVFSYETAVGRVSLKPGSERPLTVDTTFTIASLTKLLTTIAALQCVERGQFGLDDNVSSILVELRALPILKGFKEGTDEPLLVPAKNEITLRHLLTHSSGIAYDFLHPDLIRWRSLSGTPPTIFDNTPLLQRATHPLLFEPGTGFEYGYSLDWVGVLIARLNNMCLEDYILKHICEPLEITDLTFHLEKNEKIRAKLADFSLRDGGMNECFTPNNPAGRLSWVPTRVWPDPVADDFGGWGAFTSGPSFLKVLASLLRDDGELLQSETIEGMFQPQLSDASKAMLNQTLSVPDDNNRLGGSPYGLQKSWGLGGLIMLEDNSMGQKADTLRWCGLPNLYWWIDRKAGLCGLYASQLLPTGDPQSIEWAHRFEHEMYRRLKVCRSEGPIRL